MDRKAPEVNLENRKSVSRTTSETAPGPGSSSGTFDRAQINRRPGRSEGGILSLNCGSDSAGSIAALKSLNHRCIDMQFCTSTRSYFYSFVKRRSCKRVLRRLRNDPKPYRIQRYDIRSISSRADRSKITTQSPGFRDRIPGDIKHAHANRIGGSENRSHSLP